MSIGISISAAVVINCIHSRSTVPTSQISCQGICRIIITDNDHYMEIVIYNILTILCSQTVIILINCPHDKKLDQACRLHSMLVDTSLRILFQITNICGPAAIR